MCFDFLCNFVCNISRSNRNSVRYYLKCTYVWCKASVVLVRISWNLIFLDRFSKYAQTSSLMKICSVVTDLAMRTDRYTEEQSVREKERQTERQTDMTKLTLAFRNSANVPKHCCTKFLQRAAEKPLHLSEFLISIRTVISEAQRPVALTCQTHKGLSFRFASSLL